jgi:hypothetical protein
MINSLNLLLYYTTKETRSTRHCRCFDCLLFHWRCPNLGNTFCMTYNTFPGRLCRTYLCFKPYSTGYLFNNSKVTVRSIAATSFLFARIYTMDRHFYYCRISIVDIVDSTIHHEYRPESLLCGTAAAIVTKTRAGRRSSI